MFAELAVNVFDTFLNAERFNVFYINHTFLSITQNKKINNLFIWTQYLLTYILPKNNAFYVNWGSTTRYSFLFRETVATFATSNQPLKPLGPKEKTGVLEA